MALLQRLKRVEGTQSMSIWTVLLLGREVHNRVERYARSMQRKVRKVPRLCKADGRILLLASRGGDGGVARGCRGSHEGAGESGCQWGGEEV